MKKKSVVILLFAVIILLSSCGGQNNKPAQEKEITVYATVNGEQIMSDEIEYFKTRSRAQIINEYAEKYGVTDFADFWDKEFDGKTPAESLEESALEQAVEAKIKLMLMRENGVYEDVSFVGLKAKAETYNKEHENLKGNVGLKTVDLSSFYTYYVSTGEMELKNILAESTLKPTADELAAAAEKNPDLTENGQISAVVDEKYEKMIADLIDNAEIK